MERFQGVLKGLLRDMTRRDAAIPTVAAMKRVQTLLRHIRLQYPTIPELKVPKQCPKAVIIKGAHGFWSPVSAISDQARETLKSRCAKALITQDMIRYANGHPCVFTCTSTGATTSTKVSDLAQHIRVELFKQYAVVGLGASVVPQDYVVTTDWYIWDVQAAATFTSPAYYHGHTYKHEDHHVWADWWCLEVESGSGHCAEVCLSGTDAAFPLAEVVWWKLLDINDRDTIKTLFVGELSTNPDASLEAAIRFRVDAVPMSVVTPYSAGSRTAVVSMEDICLEHKLLMAPLRWIRGYRRGDLPYNAKVVLSTISSKQKGHLALKSERGGRPYRLRKMHMHGRLALLK
eukprot:TRINITY_DN706_c0_g1_i1.p1 TRINITY_DN706_c0_g1~~TRINITY_DN706_c0_g1_i1.p1  ORF type:complete len:346 (-),score=29.06 TRINITY_DN706_c0_g1_i1:31-1068(-)